MSHKLNNRSIRTIFPCEISRNRPDGPTKLSKRRSTSDLFAAKNREPGVGIDAARLVIVGVEYKLPPPRPLGVESSLSRKEALVLFLPLAPEIGRSPQSGSAARERGTLGTLDFLVLLLYFASVVALAAAAAAAISSSESSPSYSSSEALPVPLVPATGISIPF